MGDNRKEFGHRLPPDPHTVYGWCEGMPTPPGPMYGVASGMPLPQGHPYSHVTKDMPAPPQNFNNSGDDFSTNGRRIKDDSRKGRW